MTDEYDVDPCICSHGKKMHEEWNGFQECIACECSDGCCWCICMEYKAEI